MGVDPALASQFLAEYLPKIVDKLTPKGKVDPTADHQQGLAALLPSLSQSLGGKSGPVAHIEPSDPWPVIPDNKA
jgi:uncharacterized protein YidB (DUF937 family)